MKEKPPCTPGVEALKPYDPPLSGRREVLRLDFNEWLGEPHPKLQKVLQDFSVDELNMYPEDGLALQTLAKYFNIPQENLLLANGTDEALCNVYRSYVNRGEGLLLPDPGYSMMEFYGTLCEAKIVPWVLEAPGFTYDLAKAEDFLKEGGRCVTVARPNNPTGSSMNLEDLLSLSNKWPGRLFVVDEAYIDFGGESSVKAAISSTNLVVLRTFSKAWSLAGLRLGAVIGPQHLISELKKMWSPYSVNALGLHLLSELCTDTQWVEGIREEVERQRQRLKKTLEDRQIPAHFGGGNFFLLRPQGEVSKFLQHFENKGIRLRDQSSKRGLKGWIRVSIGPAEVTERFLQVLAEVTRA